MALDSPPLSRRSSLRSSSGLTSCLDYLLDVHDHVSEPAHGRRRATKDIVLEKEPLEAEERGGEGAGGRGEGGGEVGESFS